jgi:hypothetical protein
MRLLPEKPGVALVWDDVVDNVRGSYPPHAIALGAQRVQIKELLSCGTPSGAIAPRVSRTASILLCIAFQRLVLLAPAAGPSNESRTADVAAGMLRRKRAHAAFLLSEMGGFTSSLADGPRFEFTGDLPFSSTYAGRRFSSR